MVTNASRYIAVEKETAGKLAKMFNCCDKMIQLALTYRRNSELARKIRFTAVAHFDGKPMLHVPQCETLHNTTEDGRQIMRQEFDNGATLRVDKQTGEAWITDRRGEPVLHRDYIRIPELSKLQVIAENL